MSSQIVKEQASQLSIILIAIVCLVFAIGITWLIVIVTIDFIKSGRIIEKESGIIFTILILIDYFFLITCYRLTFSKPRKDDGLFSPFGLMLAGIMFLTFPAIAIISKNWWMLLDSWHFVLAAAGCFSLAHFRRKSLRRKEKEAYEKNPIPIE